MRTPLGQAKSVGELTSWGKDFVEELQNERLLEVSFESSVEELMKKQAGQSVILIIENSNISMIMIRMESVIL